MEQKHNPAISHSNPAEDASRRPTGRTSQKLARTASDGAGDQLGDGALPEFENNPYTVRNESCDWSDDWSCNASRNHLRQYVNKLCVGALDIEKPTRSSQQSHDDMNACAF